MLPSYIIQFVFSGASSIGSHSKTKGKTIIMISVMDYPMRTKFRKGPNWEMTVQIKIVMETIDGIFS